MFRSTRVFSAVLVVGALSACSYGGGESMSAADMDAEAQAIRDISAQWLQAVRAKDVATVASLFADDAETIFDGVHVRGRAAIRAAQEAEMSEEPDRTVSWSTTSVVVAASGDLAVERGSWTEDPDGPGPAVVERGEYVTTYKKTDGQWRVIVDAGTTLKASS